MTDCSEIRTFLSEYLDDALDAQAKSLADEHLRTCPACRKELESLKTLVQGMSSLQPARAPADFLDQLHKRMERPSKPTKIREWFFYPLRVKIPLQLAGAAVAALIIFSILPLEQSSLKMSSKTEQEKTDAAYPDREAKGRIAPAERPEAPVQQAAPAAAAKDESAGRPSARSKAPAEKPSPGGLPGESGAGKPATRSEALPHKAEIPEPVKDKEAREMTLNLKKQLRHKAASTEPSAAQAPASPAVSEMQRRTLAERAPAPEDKRQAAIEHESESVLFVTKAVEAARGKVLSVDHNLQTGRPESVQAQVPAGELPILYEKLRELGELQVSPEAGNEKDADLLPVKIRLIGLH